MEGWKDKTQYASWHFRTGSTATFKVLVKYLGGEESGGSYRIEEDGQDLGEKQVQTTKDGIVTEELGLWSPAAGLHTLSIKPVAILKGSLMKLLEVQLVPVK